MCLALHRNDDAKAEFQFREMVAGMQENDRANGKNIHLCNTLIPGQSLTCTEAFKTNGSSKFSKPMFHPPDCFPALHHQARIAVPCCAMRCLAGRGIVAQNSAERALHGTTVGSIAGLQSGRVRS